MSFTRAVIDSHMHLYHWYDEDGTDFISQIDAYIDRFGLRSVNLCGIPVHGCDVGNNIMCAIYKVHNPDAYAYGGLVYPSLPASVPFPDGMDAASQYNELMKVGFDGIKLLETKPLEYRMVSLPFTDPFYEGMFAQAEKDRTHFIWHVADPETFWDREKIPERFIERGWFYGDGTYPSLERIYNDVFEILERHPRLKIQFAHFFFWADHPEKLVRLFSDYPDVNVDIVPGAEMYDSFEQNHDFYKDFFIRYSNRIVYGSDVSFTVRDPKYSIDHYAKLTEAIYDSMTTDKSVSIYTAKCRGFSLSDSVCRNIFHDNFLQECSEKPREINRKALKKYIAKYEHLIKDSEEKKAILDFSVSL